jgi:hypothetical protein
MSRPAVFWLGLMGVVLLGFLLVALNQPDVPPAPYVNVAFLAAFGFPALAGWLAGMTIQELQHATFTWPLPRVRGRLAAGFLLAGTGVAAFVGLFAAQATSAQAPAAFYPLLGLAGYCVGSVLIDPLRTWVSPVAFVVVLGVGGGSQRLSDVAAAHPLTGSALLLGVALLTFARLFTRSTFRRKPFRPTSPFPGAYTLEHGVEYQRALQARARRTPRRWRKKYLGPGTWAWTRAATYENYGPLTWKKAARGLNSIAAMLAMFALYAWSNMNDLAFGDAFAKTVHEAVMHSPYVPRFGDIADSGGANVFIIFLVATLGGTVALRPRPSLTDGLSFPLSRRRRAAVVFYAGLIDVAAFFFITATILSVIGLAAGRFAGYEARFDYLPSFLLPLIGTVIAMPVAQLGGLHLGRSVRRRRGNGYGLLIVESIAFVVLVLAWSMLAPWLFVSLATRLGVSIALFVASLALLRYRLNAFFASEDLV